MPKQRDPGSKKMSPAMTFMNLTAGKWVSQAIAVSAELGIADLLKEGTKTTAQIARSANASEDSVYRLLRALASVGLFAETKNRAFRITPLGKLLCTDSPQALGAYARFVGHDSTCAPWGELGHSVLTGEPAFDRVFSMPIFEHFKSSEIAARRCGAGGKVLIVDSVIPSGNAAHFGKLLDLEMLALTPRGRERTQAEFRDLLKRSGFKLNRVIPTEIHLSLVEGART